jgi:hypothetical protein
VLGPAAAGLAVWGAVACLVHSAQAELTVSADLELGGGTFVELILNESADALRTPVLPRRQRYRFTRTLAGIDSLQLHPTDVSGVMVRCHGIDVVGPDGKVITRFGPDVLASWTTHDLTMMDTSSDAITYRTTGPNPTLVASLPEVGVSLPAGRTTFLRRLQRETWLPYALLLPLVLLVPIRPVGFWLLRASLAVAVLAVWPVVFEVVSAMDWGPTVSRVAISRAAYEGISLPATQMAVAAGFAVAGLAGFAVAFWRRWPPPRAVGEREPPGAPFLAVAGVLIAVLTAPDLPWLLAWMQSTPYDPHWDSNNILYWAYWTAHGRLPLRDFWFPYGGLFLLQEPWPAGPLITWAAAVGRYAVLAAALMLASGRRWSVLLAVMGVMLAETSSLNFAVHRYLLAVNVVLAYVAASRWQFRGRLPILTLAAALIMPLLLEPAQLVYAVPGVAAVVFVDALANRRLTDLRRGPIICAAILTAAAVPIILVLWAAGMLAETWLFYLRLGETAQYAAFPSPVEPNPWPDFPLSSIVLWTPAILLAVALAELRRPEAQARIRALALVGLAVLDFMVLQKHLIRMMPDTLVFYLFLGGISFAVLSPAASPHRRDRIGLGAGVGLLAAMLLIQERWDDRLAIAARLPARLVETTHLFVTPGMWAEANRARFAPARFERYSEQRAVVDELIHRAGGPVRLFSLTDDPVLYLLTGQPPSWHVNLYNGSPVYEQQRIVQDLRAHPPDYVVARRGRLMFDGMPIGVRVPDVLAFVVGNYAPDPPSGGWAVLRPRRPGDPIEVAFWRDFLGETLDLGMLPARLGNRELAPCAPTLACDELLVLESPTPDARSATEIRFDVEGTLIAVRVRLVSSQRRYVIPLSRLWPAVAARSSGLRLVAMPTSPFTLEWVAAARPAGSLY